MLPGPLISEFTEYIRDIRTAGEIAYAKNKLI
jgi:hypothetical protein